MPVAHISFWSLFLLAMGLLTGAALARQATVRGFVTDASDGQPLQGVNVVVEVEGSLLRGTATDKDGLYTLARIPAGRYVLKASFVGYTTATDTLTLATGDVRLLSLILNPDEEVLDEVVVETERTSGAARVIAGQQVIRPADIELVPTPDVSGDLATYLTTLPGLVSTGDRGGQLFIRGGEPWQNLILLDGMLLYQPFHILGFYSAFPVEILSRADVYAGGYGSRYGGRLSSVIDVTTRQGNKKALEGSLSLAPFVSGIRVEGPIEKDRLSFLLSARQSVIEQGAAHLVDAPLPYTFGDVYAKLHGVLTSNNQTSLSYLRTYDRGTLVAGEGNPAARPEQARGADVEADPLLAASASLGQEIRWRNTAFGGRHLILPSNFPILAEILISVSRFQTDFGPADRPSRSSTTARVNAEANITYYAGALDVHWGLFAHTLELSSRLGGIFQNVETRKEYLTEAGLYLEPEWQVNPSLNLRAGLRLHSFPSRDRGVLEPRLRAIWQRGIHEVSGAIGVYHQEITGLSDRRDASSLFTAWTATPFGDVPQATHYLLGYRVNPRSWLELSAEGFYKRHKNLYVPEWTAFPRLTTRLQPADGQAFGFDARAEIRLERFYGYVNYGLSEVTYEAKQSSLALWYGTETLKYHPPHDRRHQVNVVGQTFWRGFDMSVRWQFGSGLPFSRAFGFDGFILMDHALNPFTHTGSRRVIYEAPYNGRLPTYHRLDVSVERKVSIGKIPTTLQATLINVYNRNNLFFLDVFTQQRADQLPFIPSLGIKFDLQ